MHFFRSYGAIFALLLIPQVAAVGAPTAVLAMSSTPTPAPSSADLAVGLAEASQEPGAWSAPAGSRLVVNWDGSVGARPIAIAYTPVTSGTTVVGPTLTNANSQAVSGGSLLLLRGSGLTVRGTTSAKHVSGVNGGGSAILPGPSGMQPGDLVVVYINTSNTMVAPAGWTLRHHDGQGSVWTQAFGAVPPNLSSWSTGGGGSGWTYTAVAFGATGSAPEVVAAGGGGAQTKAAVATGTVTRPAPVVTPATATAVPATATSTPATATPVPATATRVPSTATPLPSTPVPSPSTSSSLSAHDPLGEDRCHTTALPSVNVQTDFGARGDGTTDNHTAFANAIATGKVVRVPAGTYVVSQVNLSANQTVVLCGAGQGLTTLIEAASPSQTQAMFSQYDYSGGGHLAYLEIQNMTLDGNHAHVLRRPQGSSMMNYGIVTAMVRKLLIANDEIRNGYHGLRILDVADQTNGSAGEAIIRDNWFHSMALEAGYTGGTTHNIYIAKEWPSNSVVWVDRNVIEECGSGSGSSCTLPSTTPGQSAGGLLYSPDGSAAGGPPQQIFRIKDNTFRNLGMNMVGTEEPEGEIYLYQQADNAQIINNQFINSYYEALAVFSSNNVEIAYNTVTGNGVPVSASSGYDHMEYYAIGAFSRRTYFPTYISSSGWNIHDNTVENSTWYKTGICACFSTDSSGHGTGSHVSITNNTFVENLDEFSGAHTLPIDTSGAMNVTTSGNDTTRN
jgi:parallel beta-helix repeat protein